MTFCVGIKVRDGVIALADTRIVRDSERINKEKLAPFPLAEHSLFTMTSGLRSVRDKALIYLGETIRQQQATYERLYQVVNLFGEQLRRVQSEDGPSLAATNHQFNLHAIIGGCLSQDPSPQLFHVYPEGNWVEAAVDSPYFMIGRTYYGKPILDRLLRFETPLPDALALALLAFDATRTSVTDVGCPVDVSVLATNSRRAVYKRLDDHDIRQTTEWWSQTLRNSLTSLPMEWAQGLF